MRYACAATTATAAVVLCKYSYGYSTDLYGASAASAGKDETRPGPGPSRGSFLQKPQQQQQQQHADVSPSTSVRRLCKNIPTASSITVQHGLGMGEESNTEYHGAKLKGRKGKGNRTGTPTTDDERYDEQTAAVSGIGDGRWDGRWDGRLAMRGSGKEGTVLEYSNCTVLGASLSSLGVPILQWRRRDDAAEDTWVVHTKHSERGASIP
ncbi:hypothetical protein V492_06710 [Pseudogymnoascus sp. VKM F-4246]|nr:hypothetical protein V492_06710 [Pseudogymnoascus sp. VKM F-4246]